MKKQNSILYEDQEENILIQKEEQVYSFSEGEEINGNSRVFIGNLENNSSIEFSNFIKGWETDIDFKNRFLFETEKENKRLKKYSLQLEEETKNIEFKLDRSLDELN